MATVAAGHECDRWTCKLCFKSYSCNYPFKRHLEKCLVHKDNTNIRLQLKNELLAEFRTELNKTLSEIAQNANGAMINVV